MLIEFSVQNYRSYLSRQTLSLAAASTKKRPAQHSFKSGLSTPEYLVQSACILGSNAAGKSNFVRALSFFSEFVVNSAKDMQKGEEIEVTPFRLTKRSSRQPSEFEAIFIHNGSRYQYGFSVTKERVWDEWLFATPEGGRAQSWFQRSYDRKSGAYEWDINRSVKGSRQIWKKSTRDNALFLSTANQLGSKSLSEPFDWIQHYLRTLLASEQFFHVYTAKLIKEGRKDDILHLINSIDIGIDDFLVEEEEFKLEDIPTIFSEEFKKSLKKSMGDKVHLVKSIHKTKEGDQIIFDLSDESDGTLRIFSLAGPLLDVLDNGYTLVIDELHNNLHPLALRFLVGLFHNKRINKHEAQLVFTTHDSSILSEHFMQRDQIWFVKKEPNGASQLYPLTDFKPRESEAINRGYLGGRYDAVPKIRDLVDGV